jgi:hypothetical protein
MGERGIVPDARLGFNPLPGYREPKAPYSQFLGAVKLSIVGVPKIEGLVGVRSVFDISGHVREARPI